jgi:hypothetical protein
MQALGMPPQSRNQHRMSCFGLSLTIPAAG